MIVVPGRNGDLVLRATPRERLAIESGALYIARRTRKGDVVLRRAKGGGAAQRAYLNPKPLSRATLRRIYSASEASWDRVEAEAVSRSTKMLAGKRLEDL